SIRMHLDARAAIAKIPSLAAKRRSKCPYFESDRITGPNAKRRRIRGVNGGRKIVRLPAREDLHNRHIVSRASPPIDDFQQFAVSARFLITPFHARSFGRCFISKSPFVSRNLSTRTP